MLGGLLKRVFGSVNDRTVAGLQKRVDAINAQEDQISALDDEALKAKTDEFRTRVANGETLDDILEEAFQSGRDTVITVDQGASVILENVRLSDLDADDNFIV